MKNDMMIFEKEEFGKVRIVMQDEQPWFVAKDVAEILGYKNSSEAVRDNCKYVEILKSSSELLLDIPARGLQVIPESDLYRLIMRSQLESAEKFQDWVVEEVLPSIRKTAQALDSITYTGNIEGIVYSSGSVATTTSIKIAEVFQRNHRDILRAIDTKFKNGDERCVQFCTHHIKEIVYTDTYGRLQRQYELDEEGFSFIALSLTGEQADLFKIKYIEAFSKMREVITNMFKARVVESVLPQDNRLRQHLYIIKNPLNETIKIGVAQDVEKRLRQLQTGAGIELELVYQSLICSNAFSIEKDIHTKFEEYRTFGEWFRISPEQVIAFAEQQTFILKSEFVKYVSIFNSRD